MLLFVAGCGGLAELDSEEVATVSQARAATETAAIDGSLKPGDEKKFEELIVLCREKPLAEADGKSMREVLAEMEKWLGLLKASISRVHQSHKLHPNTHDAPQSSASAGALAAHVKQLSF